MTGSLAGRSAIITGAGGGLGRAFALGFARAGARVVAADLDGEAAAETCAVVLGEVDGAKAVAVIVDVADEASTGAMASAAVGRFGSIDVLVERLSAVGPLRRLQERPHRPLARDGRELGDDRVRVNALAPGFTLTDAVASRSTMRSPTGLRAGRSSAAFSPTTSSGRRCSSPRRRAR